jgi:hypothetical protein
MRLGGTDWTVSDRLVIGRWRVRIPPRAPKVQVRGHLRRCRLRGGTRRSFLWVGSSRRRRARPASLHRCAARLPTGLSLGPESGWVYGQAPIAGPLQGVASGVTRKLHSTLGGAELLVDDLQRSLHRIRTEATDAVVKWMVEELQEEQHRHDHRNHGPHE